MSKGKKHKCDQELNSVTTFWDQDNSYDLRTDMGYQDPPL